LAGKRPANYPVIKGNASASNRKHVWNNGNESNEKVTIAIWRVTSSSNKTIGQIGHLLSIYWAITTQT